MKNKVCKLIVWSLLLSVFLEVFVFNYRSLESLGFQEVTEFSVDDRMEKQERIFEIDQLHSELKNIYLDFSDREEEISEYQIRLYAVDEGNEVYYKLPTLTVREWDESSKYVKLNLSGKAKKIKITFPETEEEDMGNIQLNRIRLNIPRPFMWKWERMLGIFCLIPLLFFTRPSSMLYRRQYDIKKKKHQMVCMVWLTLQIAIMLLVSLDNPRYVHPSWRYHYQYEKLAESLAKGQFYLEEEPSDELKAMDNPYDTNLRKKQDVSFRWDHAYYEGKYYVYFGIVPVLIFYLPFYLITGQGFPNIMGIIICEIVLIYGVMALLHAIVKKYFHKVSLGLFLMLDLLLFWGCGGWIVAKYCTFYSLPLIMSVCFVIWGLYFWFTSVRRESVQWKRIFLGSLCMALVAGCRPQMLLASFLGLPILWGTIKQAFTRQGEWKKLILCLFPYVAAAAFLMYYNYSRFGSPFDFGANYNLTTNDMTKRGFRLDRLPFGFFAFLFQPPAFSAQFPFMESVHMVTKYQGVTIYEKMYGGIFMLNPILWSNFLCVRLKRDLKEKRLWGIVLISLISAAVIVAADIQMAGILMRYLCDFGIFLCLPMILIVLTINEKEKSPIFQEVIVGITGITAVMAFLWVWI